MKTELKKIIEGITMPRATHAQRIATYWFAISFVAVGCLAEAETWAILIALANFAASVLVMRMVGCPDAEEGTK